MTLLEMLIFSVVLTGTSEAFSCSETNAGNYVCSNGLSAMPFGPDELRFSTGVTVAKGGPNGSYLISSGLKNWRDVTGMARFENGVGIRVLVPGQRIETTTGLICLENRNGQGRCVVKPKR